MIVLIVIACARAFMTLGLGQYLTIETLKSQQDALRAYHYGHMGSVIGGYFVIYIASTELSLPGAAILTLAGGAIFGFWAGTLIVSFASSIGVIEGSDHCHTNIIMSYSTKIKYHIPQCDKMFYIEKRGVQ